MKTALTIVALWFAGLGAASQYAKTAVALGEIAALYSDAGAGVGFVVSSIGFVGVVLGLVAGVAVARFGFRRMLLGGLVAGAALSLFQSGLPSLPLMLASRVVEGASHLAVVVAAPTLMAQLSPDRWRPLVMTAWSMFFGVAFIAMAVIGNPLMESGGLAALFLWHGVYMVVVAGILAILLPRDVVRVSNEVGLGILARHRAAYASARIGAPALGWLFYTLLFVSLLAVLPQLLPPEQALVVAGTAPLYSLAASLFTGVVLLPLLPAVTVVMLGFVAGLALLPFVVFAGVTPALFIALFVAMGLIQSASFAAVPQLNASLEDRALSNGAMAQMGNLGNAIGTPLVLLLLFHGGTAGFVAFAVLGFGGGLLAHVVSARRRAVSSG